MTLSSVSSLQSQWALSSYLSSVKRWIWLKSLSTILETLWCFKSSRTGGGGHLVIQCWLPGTPQQRSAEGSSDCARQNYASALWFFSVKEAMYLNAECGCINLLIGEESFDRLIYNTVASLLFRTMHLNMPSCVCGKSISLYVNLKLKIWNTSLLIKVLLSALWKDELSEEHPRSLRRGDFLFCF